MVIEAGEKTMAS